MGTKRGHIIILLLILCSGAKGQGDMSFQIIDSTTYSNYVSGDWKNLISLGNQAIKSGIDYKYLRQRMGYAYYITGDFVKAEKSFEKALAYDSYDSFTLAYLYFTNIYLLKPGVAGYYASRMSEESRKAYQVTSSKVIESIDFELSVKVPSTTLRSDPHYYRFGVGSRPWSRLSIYQSVSAFNQYITIRYPTQYDQYRERQYEYYGILKYSVMSRWGLKAGYHFMYSDYSSGVLYSNLGYAGLSADYNIFNISFDGSFLSNTQVSVTQAGVRAGLVFPGTLNVRLSSNLAMLIRQDKTDLVFSQRIGLRVNRKTWIDGEVTWGNMDYYNDFDAMYVYNSIDPMNFRAGINTYYQISDHLLFWINLGSENKHYYESDQYYYNQFSFLGGLQWRF